MTKHLVLLAAFAVSGGLAQEAPMHAHPERHRMLDLPEFSFTYREAPSDAGHVSLSLPGSDGEFVGTLLPTVRIEAARVHLTKDEILSEAGRMDYAQKTHLTDTYRAVFGPLAQLATYYYNWPSILMGWHPNEAEAMLLYEQEQRTRRVNEMDRLIYLQVVDRQKEPKELKAMQDELSRIRHDFRVQRRGLRNLE